MDELIEMYARQAGIEGVDTRKLKVFADFIWANQKSKIESLECELFAAKAQNEIYRNVVNDSY